MRFDDLTYGVPFKTVNTLIVDPNVYIRIKPKETELPFNLAKDTKTGKEIIVCGDTEVVQLD